MTYFVFSTVQLKCSSEKSKRPEEIFPNVFFTSNAKCVVQPAKNVFGGVTVTLAPACKIPAPPSFSLDAVSSKVFTGSC